MKTLIILTLVVALILSLGLTCTPVTPPEGRPIWRTYIPTGGGGWAEIDNPCGDAAILDMDTQDVHPWGLAFDGVTADECAQWQAVLPMTYRNGTPLYATVYWTTITGDGGGAETVSWDFYASAWANDDTLELAWANGITIDADTWHADEDMHITAESAAVTITGGAERGDFLMFRVCRDITDDTLEDDVQLLAVRVRYLGE
jgi:hypothetical protein